MKTKKRKLNVRLLRRIQRHISEEPRRFFMDGFSAKNVYGDWSSQAQWFKDLSKIPPPCGTAACIAGTANLLTNGKYLDDDERAARLIGVEPINYNWMQPTKHPLFILGGWPMKFRKPYRKAKTPKRRAKIACARIDHLIKTGE